MVKADTTHNKPSTINSQSTGYATYKTKCSFSFKNDILHIHLLPDVPKYNYMSREEEIKLYITSSSVSTCQKLRIIVTNYLQYSAPY